MNRLRELDELLLSPFNVVELRRFLRYLPEAEGVVQNLPGPGAGFAQVASDAAERLEKAGLINDAFFGALLDERPRRKADIGRVAGLWHDVGKYSAEFQAYLCKENGFEAHLEQYKGRVDHSTAGAQHAVRVLTELDQAQAGRLLAYCIA